MSVLTQLSASELREADEVDSGWADLAHSPTPPRQHVDKVFVRADVPLMVLLFR